MSDLPSSDRSSALTFIPATPGTPSPQDSISNRRSDTIPETPRPERISRLPAMSLDVESPMEAMRATMLQIQQQMQEQMQAQAQQQRDFEARIQALLAVNKEALEAPKVSIAPTPVHVNEPVDQPLDDAAKHIPSKDHLGPPPGFGYQQPKSSQTSYVREPSFPHSYADYFPSSVQTTHLRSSPPTCRSLKERKAKTWRHGSNSCLVSLKQPSVPMLRSPLFCLSFSKTLL